MASSSWFRSFLNRAQFFTRPVPLISSVVVVVLGIFIWESVTHPEWFGAYSTDEDSPLGDLDLSGLTPEEQAAVADIDNLSLLLSDLGVTAEGRPSIQVGAEGEQTTQQTLLQDLLAISATSQSSPATNGENPFDKYLEQYRFIGEVAPGANSTSTASAASDRGASSYDQFQPTGTTIPNRASLTPLEQALQQQRAAAAISETTMDATATANPERSSSSDTVISAEAEDEALRLPAGEFGSQAVTIPGIPYPVLPTSPQMSPPPGTTGYTPPASLELMPPVPNGGSSVSLPSAGINSSPLTLPSVSTGAGVPNLTTPRVDVSNGAVTPYTPTQPLVSPTAPQVPVSPFAVPRAPGSYTGGGYINTFSNPSGPSN